MDFSNENPYTARIERETSNRKAPLQKARIRPKSSKTRPQGSEMLWPAQKTIGLQNDTANLDKERRPHASMN